MISSVTRNVWSSSEHRVLEQNRSHPKIRRQLTVSPGKLRLLVGRVWTHRWQKRLELMRNSTRENVDSRRSEFTSFAFGAFVSALHPWPQFLPWHVVTFQHWSCWRAHGYIPLYQFSQEISSLTLERIFYEAISRYFLASIAIASTDLLLPHSKKRWSKESLHLASLRRRIVPHTH